MIMGAALALHEDSVVMMIIVKSSADKRGRILRISLVDRYSRFKRLALTEEKVRENR